MHTCTSAIIKLMASLIRLRVYFFAKPNKLPSPINSGLISVLENIISNFSNLQKNEVEWRWQMWWKNELTLKYEW